MKVQIVPVTAFQQNCSIIKCEETNRLAIVDPGGDASRINEAVSSMGGKVEKILITHAHIDHAGATKEVADYYEVPIEGPHKEDQFWIDKLSDQSRMFQFPNAQPFVPTRWLEQSDTVSVGNIQLEVRHCPGHTPGHVIFINHEHKLCWVGDVIFKGSIGRTDFPRGDHETLINAIKENVLSLEDDYQFISGHGDVSNVGYERKTNPFIN
jgi:glyoxylase-like metal-dependent hydrolase (beta-lactamase superfamily II)